MPYVRQDDVSNKPIRAKFSWLRKTSLKLTIKTDFYRGYSIREKHLSASSANYHHVYAYRVAVQLDNALAPIRPAH
jgi:hypothetical protein